MIINNLKYLDQLDCIIIYWKDYNRFKSKMLITCHGSIHKIKSSNLSDLRSL